MSFEPDQSASPEGAPTGGAADLDETFATGPRCRLVLANVRGRVQVTGWDEPKVHVQATRRPGSANDAVFQATRIEAWHDGEVVTVRTVFDGFPGAGEWNQWWRDLSSAVQSLEQLFRGRTPAKVDYVVRVPRQAKLALNAVSGGMTVEDVGGETRVRTVSGDCTVVRVVGDLDLQTVDGRISGRALAGRARAQTVDGRIDLSGSLAGLRAQTVSGGVELAGPLVATGRYDFRTVSGDATLRLTPGTGASISMEAVSGAVDGDLPVKVTEERRRPGKHRWQGEVGGGGATVRFQTVSGDLHLLRFPDEEARATLPGPETREPAEQPSDESPELAVLRRLERGDVSVEEALRELEAVRGGRE